MIDTDFLHQLDRFSILVNKKVTSNYMGERESHAVGQGLVFRDHSHYTPGDDFRSIDWRVYGRTDKFFVKRYEEERNLTVHIVLDFSASMNFGSRVTKADYASMIGVGFAHLAMKNNERFVLSTFSEELEIFKPHKGMKQLASIVTYLNSKKPKGKTALDHALASYKKIINTRSLVIVVSDFLYPLDEIKQTLARLKRHEVLFVQVLDKVEKELDMEGDFKLKDLETNSVMHTYINPYTRNKYQEELDNHIEEIKRSCDDVGAQFHTAHTGINVFDTLWDILNTRAVFTRKGS